MQFPNLPTYGTHDTANITKSIQAFNNHLYALLII